MSPFLFSLYPVLALLAHNIGEIAIADAGRALIVSLLFAGLLLLVLRLFIRDWTRAALVASGWLVLFFSYGHLYTLLRQWEFAGVSPGKHSLMLPLWLALAIVWIWWVARRLQEPRTLARYFNLIGLFLLVMPLYNILAHTIQQARADPLPIQSSTNIQPESQQTSSIANSQRPDIYYIILDGYGRDDTLQEIYNYDNRPFLDALQQRGFYIASDSQTNYNQTALSLASSLNLDYLDEFAQQMGPDSKDRAPLARLIKESSLVEQLDALGYQTVAYETGYERTELRSADYYFSLDTEVVPQVTSLWTFNGFESLLLESTLMRAIFDLSMFSPTSLRNLTRNAEYQAHRERVLYTLQRLDDPATMPGDYFVFAHIVTPHPPFIFGPEGEARFPNRAYVIADGDYYPGDRQEYLQAYTDQVTFINQQILSVLDRILARSDTPPVIVLQGDHGPGAYLVWDSPEESNLQERFAILNAYYLPPAAQSEHSADQEPPAFVEPYPSITPVNTFRMILNRYLGGGYARLEDRSSFASWERPYDFTLVPPIPHTQP